MRTFTVDDPIGDEIGQHLRLAKKVLIAIENDGPHLVPEVCEVAIGALLRIRRLAYALEAREHGRG